MSPNCFRIPQSYCVDVTGKDAATVVNNLCTNDIVKMQVGDCLEAFVTNVRGWVVAHAVIVRKENSVLLIGRHADPRQIANHIDRYIIREDAAITNHSDQVVIVGLAQPSDELFSEVAMPDPIGTATTVLANDQLSCNVPFAGLNRLMLLQLPCDAPDDGVLDRVSQLTNFEVALGTPSEFEHLRIAQRWPAPDAELTEKTLPQEMDRDAAAISFTKGCYLGQETIARLDARGQLQKKLSLIQFSPAAQPALGSAILLGEKQVGTLTSYASRDASSLGLSTLRRGAFDAGTEVTCDGLAAHVVEPNSD